jgi:hypothetical protein
MSTWHTEDKEWMKERKRQWASVSKRVNDLYFIDSEWKPAIKHFFLTGEEKKGDFTMSTLDTAPLFALWFDPDDSIEHWQWLRKHRYTDLKWRYSGSRLLEVLRGLGELPEGGVGSFFDGRDERLYDFFFKRGLKREHFPEMDDMKFENHASVCYQSIICSINYALDTESWGTPNPYNSVNYRLEEWRDSIILAYDPERKELEDMLECLDQTLAEPDRFVNERVDLARRVNEVLDDPTLPTEFKQRIKELRERPCHPHCLKEDENSVSYALVRIIADSKEFVERIAKILDEDKRVELELETQDSNDIDWDELKYLESPKECDVNAKQLTAKFELVDQDDIEDILNLIQGMKGFEICYALCAEDYDRNFLKYHDGNFQLVYANGDDIDIDRSLDGMEWGTQALDWLIANKG